MSKRIPSTVFLSEAEASIGLKTISIPYITKFATEKHELKL